MGPKIKKKTLKIIEKVFHRAPRALSASRRFGNNSFI